MFLIGAGLIVLGAVALVLLARPDETVLRQKEGASSAAGASAVIPIQVDFGAPDLSLQDVDGDAVALADYRGQVLLVNNWAIWCPPCKAEMPILQAYFEAHRRQSFTIIGIEAGEPPAEVAAFVEQYRLTFPIWVDADQVAMLAFGNFNLPSSYVIDRSGRVRLAWTGAISREALEKYVTPLIEE
jgi:peroxiredoxin